MNHPRRLLLYLGALCLLFGCSPAYTTNYTRPDLYHPRSMAAKSTITKGLKVCIEGPNKPIIARDGSQYIFLICDQSANGSVDGKSAEQKTPPSKIDESKPSKLTPSKEDHLKINDAPMVLIYPPVRSNITKKDNGWYELTIDGLEFKGLDVIEMVIIGKAAAGLSVVEAVKKGFYLRTTFDVKGNDERDFTEAMRPRSLQPSEAGMPQIIKIQSDSVDIRDKEPSFLVTYYGLLPESGVKDAVSIRTDPIDVIQEVKQDADSVNSLRVYLKREKIKGMKSFIAEAEVRDNTNDKNRMKKIAAGIIGTQIVKISGFQSFTTSLNIWSIDDTAKEFGKTFADLFIACDVYFSNPNEKPLLIYGASLQPIVRYLASVDDAKKHFGETVIDQPDILPTLRDYMGRPVNYLDFKENRRPMSFSDIIAIFEYQQKGHPYQRFIDILKSVGQLAAAAAVFISGADYSKGVAIFTGVFTPELEKNLLWDINLHLKNLQTRSLREIEEIAPRSQLHRVVFFPRGPIYDLLPLMPVYIAEIRPDAAAIEAAVIEKLESIKSTTMTSP